MRFIIMMLVIIENAAWSLISLIMGSELAFIGFLAVACVFVGLLVTEIKRDIAPKGRHAGW